MIKCRKKLVLIGGGGHCNAVVNVVEHENKFQILGILEKNKISAKKNLHGYPILGTDDCIKDLIKEGVYFHITIGQIYSSDLRMQISSLISEHGGKLATIVSPRAYIAQNVKIGDGTVVMHDALINSNAKVGLNCIINSKAIIEHDAIIGDFNHISTGAIVNGGSQVGAGCFIGSNAVIPHNDIVEDGFFLKAGQVFGKKYVADNVVYKDSY